MPLAGFEPAVSASKQLLAHATEISNHKNYSEHKSAMFNDINVFIKPIQNRCEHSEYEAAKKV
jgi:hypothetical protein